MLESIKILFDKTLQLIQSKGYYNTLFDKGMWFPYNNNRLKLKDDIQIYKLSMPHIVHGKNI